MATNTLAEQLVKLLPTDKFYSDFISPAAKQLGYALEDLLKCLRLATFPIQIGSATQTQLENFIHTAVSKVPEARRISPAPQILGPVVEAVRYEISGSEIEQMFAELLSRSMDKDYMGEAHPAFPLLVRQLSIDEARIIKIIRESSLSGIVFKRTLTTKLYIETLTHDSFETENFPLSDIMFENNFRFYINHLRSLGILDLSVLKPEAIFKNDIQVGNISSWEYKLTDLGNLLADACLPKM